MKKYKDFINRSNLDEDVLKDKEKSAVVLIRALENPKINEQQR
jgi:hypothetical protein